MIGQGLSFSAPFVMAWPVADRSWPAPAVVLHAPSIGAVASSRSKAEAIDLFMRMVNILWATLTDWLIRSIERVLPILRVLEIGRLSLIASPFGCRRHSLAVIIRKIERPHHLTAELSQVLLPYARYPNARC